NVGRGLFATDEPACGITMEGPKGRSSRVELAGRGGRRGFGRPRGNPHHEPFPDRLAVAGDRDPVRGSKRRPRSPRGDLGSWLDVGRVLPSLLGSLLSESLVGVHICFL